MSHIRDPVVAGQFYEGNKDDLIKRLEWCFKHPLGPGKLPQERGEGFGQIISAQVPHAGYIYSGPAAAHTYYALSQQEKPDTVIILGPNHTGLGMPVALYAKGAWKTPLGVLEVDEEFSSLLLKSDIIQEDYLAHSSEHSIEVQLPFLQYIYGSDIKIVPIAMMDQRYETAKRVAEVIINAMNVSNKRVLILASSDMTHYEPHDIAREKDLEVLQLIENLEIEMFYNYIIRENLTMCGYGPVMVAMVVSKYFGGTGLLLKYYTSGDITGDKSWVVGYASVIFGKGIIKPLKKSNKLKESIMPV